MQSSILENIHSLFPNQPKGSINQFNWTISTDWLYAVHRSFQMPLQTYVLAVHLCNLVFGGAVIPNDRKQLVLLVCLKLANDQMDDFVVLSDRKYTKLAGGSYEAEELVPMLQVIVTLLSGKIRPPTFYDVIINMEVAMELKRDTLDLAVLLGIHAVDIYNMDLIEFCEACVRLVQSNFDKNVSNQFYHWLSEIPPSSEMLLHLEKRHSPIPRLIEQLDHREPVYSMSYSAIAINALPTPQRTPKVMIEAEIAHGTYGAVRLIRKHGTRYVRKTQTLSESALREISILSTYKHKNVVVVDEFSFENKELIIDMEVGESLEILMYPERNRRMEYWSDVYLDGHPEVTSSVVIKKPFRRDIQRNILEGVAYLHSYGIIHRDIKPQNIIMVKGIPKLIDFGLSYSICLSPDDNTVKTDSVYTVSQSPLELLWHPEEPKRYAFETDIWALASTFLEMETGVIPFYYGFMFPVELPGDYREGSESTIWCIAKILGSPEPEGIYADFPLSYPGTGLEFLQDDYKELLLKMFDYQPKNRPTAVECLSR